MIIEELRNDIAEAVLLYTKKFNDRKKISLTRQLDIASIEAFLLGSDPVMICQQLNTYLDSIAIPYFTWLTIIDVNAFVRPFKIVLQQDKYQEINLLRTLLAEKEGVITSYQGQVSQTRRYEDESVERRIETILGELQLLRNENSYLYRTLEALDKKISRIENENKLNLERAIAAEQELNQLRRKFGSDQSAPNIKRVAVPETKSDSDSQARARLN